MFLITKVVKVQRNLSKTCSMKTKGQSLIYLNAEKGGVKKKKKGVDISGNIKELDCSVERKK